MFQKDRAESADGATAHNKHGFTGLQVQAMERVQCHGHRLCRGSDVERQIAGQAVQQACRQDYFFGKAAITEFANKAQFCAEVVTTLAAG
jgi:hypothetical protein